MNNLKKSMISLIVLSFTAILFCQIPQTINFQGALKDANGQPVNDSKYMEFRIYDVLTGGTALWSESHSAVTISGGIFSVELGSTASFPAGIFSNPNLYITYILGGESNEMTPRRKIQSVPYSFVSGESYLAYSADNAANLSGVPLTGLVQQDSLGNAGINGTMTANAFVGDGSALTGITSIYDTTFIHSTGPDTMTANTNGATFTIKNANPSNGDAIKINGGYQGVRMDSVTTGVYVINANYNGYAAGTVGNQGLSVFSSGAEGVYVQNAGSDGISVYQAGSPTSYTISSANNGFEVAGAEGDGLYVGYAGDDGISIENVADNGVDVSTTSGSGFYVGNAGEYGYDVYSSDWDGFHASFVGVPTDFSFGSDNNGFEVAGTEGNGLYVGYADLDGVNVKEALINGIHIEEAGGYGVLIDSTANDGIYIKKTGNPTTINTSASKNG
ncbi:MAG TPA: hypothetical protein ENL20_07125, partial [Candidatus Cloacimonetes bacterium]|nr:hypothetical protein [Candidatus Cloacimonadota bacterium]